MVVGIGHFQCILNRKREGISQIEACKIANAGEKSAQMQTQITSDSDPRRSVTRAALGHLTQRVQELDGIGWQTANAKRMHSKSAKPCNKVRDTRTDPSLRPWGLQ